MNIPIYTIEGHCAGTRALKVVEALLLTNRVIVIRNRKGNITRAFYRKLDGCTPIARTIYTGTKYSFREKLPSGHQCHDLKRLDGSRGGVNYAPKSLRPIFLTVLTSCLVEATPLTHSGSREGLGPSQQKTVSG